MEEKAKSSVNINIYGGTNQILPNPSKRNSISTTYKESPKCLHRKPRPAHGLLTMNAASPSI